jgi:hypothetical protein
MQGMYDASRVEANTDMRMATHLATQVQERVSIPIPMPIHEPLRIYMPRIVKRTDFDGLHPIQRARE